MAIVVKLEKIKDFREAFVFAYEYRKDGLDTYLAEFIKDVMCNVQLDQKDQKRLDDLLESISAFMEDYSGTELEDKQIYEFELKAEKFLNVYKNKLPLYLIMYINDDRCWSVEVHTESQIKYNGLKTITDILSPPDEN